LISPFPENHVTDPAFHSSTLVTTHVDDLFRDSTFVARKPDILCGDPYFVFLRRFSLKAPMTSLSPRAPISFQFTKDHIRTHVHRHAVESSS